MKAINEDDKINLMMLIQGLNMGGLENTVVELANGLSKSYRKYICCYDNIGFLINKVNANCNVIYLKRKSGFDIAFIFRLVAQLRRNRINILHSHNNTAFFYGCLASFLARTPGFIYTEHGRTGELSKKAILANRLLNLRKPVCTVVAKYLIKKLVEEEGFDKNRIYYVPNGVADIKKSDNCCQYIRKELGINRDAIMICAIGRLDPIKNHELLIRACKFIINKFSDVYVVIVGDGPHKKQLYDAIKIEGLIKRVLLLGERADVDAILNTSDIYVLPSLSEGMSLTLLEAMSAGVPIIATDVGGNSNILANGECGLIVQSNNEKQLIKAVQLLISNEKKRDELKSKARARYESEFTLVRMVKRYDELYKLVLLKR